VAEGTPFRGLLYGGLMKTPSGIKVIEFNCRFGDPETEVVLPRLESDFYRMLSAVVDGTEMPAITWTEDAVIGFVMASKGYPGSYEKGHVIEGLSEDALGVEGCDDSVRVYHMGTKSSEGRILTSGGRVLMVTGRGETLAQASASARAAISRITCDNLFYRPDIGWQAL